MMTVREWLNKNDRFDEAVMIDAHGSKCLFWSDDNDAKYDAHVIRIAASANCPWLALIYTDFRG